MPLSQYIDMSNKLEMEVPARAPDTQNYNGDDIDEDQDLDPPPRDPISYSKALSHVLELMDFCIGDDKCFELVIELKARLNKMFVTKQVECKSKQSTLCNFLSRSST